MSGKADILSRISGSGGNGLSFLPDLTLWMQWHEERETLPEAWQSFSLADIARALGFPVFDVARAWRVETPGVEIKTVVEGATRTVITETSAGRLDRPLGSRSRRCLMADGALGQDSGGRAGGTGTRAGTHVRPG